MPEELAMVLLRELDDEIAALSVTTDETTVVGLGTVSGGVIMAVGELVVRGLQDMDIYIRLRKAAYSLSSRSSAASPPSEVVEDVLELQRVGLYSESVRKYAWSLILLLMADESTAGLFSRLLLKWPMVEYQLFVRQLAACKLSDWVVNPASPPPPADKHAQDTHLPPTDQRRHLNQTFFNIIRDLLTRDSAPLHELFDLSEFAAMMTDYTPFGQVGDGDPICRLFTSFILNIHDRLGNSWLIQYALHWNLPANSFISFMQSGPEELWAPVVKVIIDSILPWTKRDPQRDDVDPVFDRFPQFRSLEVAHPASPFIVLSVHLAAASEHAARRFVEAGLLSVQIQMWAHEYPIPGQMNEWWNPEQFDPMRAGYLATLGILSLQTSADICAEHLVANGAGRAVLGPTLWRMLLPSSFSLPVGNEPRPDIVLAIYKVMLSISEILCTRDTEGVLNFSMGHVTNLVHIASYSVDGQWAPLEMRHAAARAFLYCAMTPEDCWNNLIHYLINHHQGEGYSIFHVIRLLLRSPEVLAASSKEATYLMMLYERAMSRGVIVANPVDRFLILVVRAVGADATLLQSFMDAGMLALVKAVLEGDYDLVSGGTPMTDEQKEKRQYICSELQRGCGLMHADMLKGGKVITELPF